MAELFGKEWTFQSMVFGSTLEQYAYYSLVVLGFAVLGKIVRYVIDNYARHWVKKTASNWDDLLLDVASIVIPFLFFVVGLSVSANLFLTFPSVAGEEFYYKVVGLIALAAIVYTFVRFIDLFAERILIRLAARTKSNLDDQLVPLIKRLLKYGVISMALLIALDNFGYDITALLAGLGIGGLAIAFAAQETVKDVFGGITIFANKSFFVGDQITISGITGKVEAINMRTTRIRNLEGRLVTIPNGKMAQENIENWSRAPARRTFIALGVVYDTSSHKLDQAKEIIQKILEKTPGVKKDTEKDKNILVWFSEFAASSLNINVIYWVEDQKNLLAIWDQVNSTIKRQFEEANIEFAFPTQTLYYKNISRPFHNENKSRKREVG